MKSRFATALFGLITFAITGCSTESAETREYRIDTDGAPETKDRRSYESLGDVTFTTNQKYKIALIDGAEAAPHFLLVNMKQRVGNKVESDQKGLAIPIIDGMKSLDCQHYYDVDEDKEDEAPVPVCEFEVIGYMEMDGPAQLSKGKAN